MSESPGPAAGRGVRAWWTRNRSALIIGMAFGVLLIFLLDGLAGLSRTASHPRARPVPSLGHATAIRGASGSLYLLTGSNGSLPGGLEASQLWRLSPATGTVVSGPAVPAGAAPADSALPGVPVLEVLGDRLLIGAAVRADEPAFVTIAPFFLWSVPVGFQAGLATPVVETTAFSVRGLEAAFIRSAGWAWPPVRHVEAVGTWLPGQPEHLVYQSQAPAGLRLTAAYHVEGRVFVSGTAGGGRCEWILCSNPPRAFVAEAREQELRTVLRRWRVLAPSPDGTFLLVQRDEGQPIVQGPGGRLVLPPPRDAWVWRPGASPVRFPSPVAIQRVVAWSADGRLLAVDGAADGRIGLYMVDGAHAVRVGLPAQDAGETIVTGAVDIPTALGATFSGDDRFLFLTTGRTVFTYDIEAHRLTRMQLPAVVADLPVFDLAWAPGR